MEFAGVDGSITAIDRDCELFRNLGLDQESQGRRRFSRHDFRNLVLGEFLPIERILLQYLIQCSATPDRGQYDTTCSRHFTSGEMKVSQPILLVQEPDMFRNVPVDFLEW